jgi:hypothetical protein
MRKVMDKVVNDTHKIVSVNTCEFYPVANEDLIIRKNDTEIQGNAEEEGNYYASNEPRAKSILVHYISPEIDYNLVLMMAQADAMQVMSIRTWGCKISILSAKLPWTIPKMCNGAELKKASSDCAISSLFSGG